MDTNDKGEIALLKVEIRAAELGFVVLKPTTSHRRYDIVLDCGSKFRRVQVKLAGSRSIKAANSFLLDLRKVTRGGQRSKRFYSADEIDAVLVYLPNLDQIAWLGPEVFHGRATLPDGCRLSLVMETLRSSRTRSSADRAQLCGS